MWVVEEMIKYQCDIESCPIGIVAFGTGNDFSRVLGKYFNTLKAI